MVEIDKDYAFEGPEGTVRPRRPVRGAPPADRLPLHVRPRVGGRLPELHGRHRRDVAAASSTHLHTRDTSSPWCRARRWRSSSAGRRSKGWDDPLVLVVRHRLQLRLRRHDRRVAWRRPTYNFRTKAEYERGRRTSSARPAVRDARAGAASCGSTAASSTPTRSTPAALESTGGSYYFLDLTALGRQEEWEEPKGRTESRPGRAAGLRELEPLADRRGKRLRRLDGREVADAVERRAGRRRRRRRRAGRTRPAEQRVVLRQRTRVGAAIRSPRAGAPRRATRRSCRSRRGTTRSRRSSRPAPRRRGVVVEARVAGREGRPDQ